MPAVGPVAADLTRWRIVGGAVLDLGQNFEAPRVETALVGVVQGLQEIDLLPGSHQRVAGVSDVGHQVDFLEHGQLIEILPTGLEAVPGVGDAGCQQPGMVWLPKITGVLCKTFETRLPTAET